MHKVSNHSLKFGLAALMLVVAPLSAAAQGYAAVDLGPGYPGGINSAGHIVLSDGINGAVIWRDGLTTFLGAFGPTDINDLDQVAGVTGGRGVLWSRGATTVLSPVTGATHSEAYALNNTGVVVGRSVASNPLVVQATKWVSGVASPLHTPLGYLSEAYDINDAGDILGVRGPDRFRMSPVIWRADGRVEILNGLPDGPLFPIAISGSGQVLVATPVGALLWQNGAITYVSPGKGYGAAALNNTGGVFATQPTSRSTCSGDGYRGLLWRHGIERVIYDDESDTQTLPIRLNDSDVGVALRIVASPPTGTGTDCTYQSRIILLIPPAPAQLTTELSAAVDELVSSGLLDGANATSLVTQLGTAVDKLQTGATTTAINLLGAFVNKTNALLHSGRLSLAEAEKLVAAAQQVISRITGGG